MTDDTKQTPNDPAPVQGAAPNPPTPPAPAEDTKPGATEGTKAPAAKAPASKAKGAAKNAAAKAPRAKAQKGPVKTQTHNPPTPPAPAEVKEPEATQSPFDQALAFVMRPDIEGDYVNDPRDPGGETKFGISKRAFPNVNIANLTREKAATLYQEHYWNTVRGDDLPPAIAIAAFDCAVNQGVKAATRLLQKALKVQADGVIGPVTLGAAKTADPDMVIEDFLSWRLRRYAFTAGAATYMRGWARRVLALQTFLRAAAST